MTSPARISVLLVDDSEVVRLGLRTLLGAEPDLHVVAEAGTIADALRLAATAKPAVILLDVRLPDGNGVDACRELMRRHPAARIIMLTSMADDQLVEDAIRAGAHGYLLKDINARGLVQAIRDAAAGKSTLDPAITARVLALARSGAPSSTAPSPLAALSAQEQRVLALIAKGRTNKEVAMELNLAEKTVKNYLSNLFEKLHVSRRAEAAALYAQENKS
ncbi:response regulator transcription factor [Horticoccus luteus]|uniref:Response regulator transcription factor n=1 Tax=Horticoccus luteus TaxID=2862869 RepID=A0A8F9XK44_9BACT|nr:response regulator transcription factor [Horticoccus luteus]QYM77709.1 response regulator transcription factor [Horticoccus luteus]